MSTGVSSRERSALERLNRRFHRLLNRTFAACQTADYDTDFDLDRSQVHEFIEE